MTCELSNTACCAHHRLGCLCAWCSAQTGCCSPLAVLLSSIILEHHAMCGCCHSDLWTQLTKGRVALQRVQQHSVLLQQFCVFGTQRSEAGCCLVLPVHTPCEPQEEPQAADAQDCASQAGPGCCQGFC